MKKQVLKFKDGTIITFDPSCVKVHCLPWHKRFKLWIQNNFAFCFLKPKYLFIKNPCKKCLVQPKCETWCSDKNEYRDFQGPFKSVRFAKFYLAFIYVTVTIFAIALINTFFA